MKAAICLVSLCILAGLVSADQYAWEAGKTYTYFSHGRILAGISEINTQYSGLEIFYSVQLIVIGPKRVHLRPYNFRVSEVNAVQDGGWRDVPSLKGTIPVELPAKIKEYLESPVEITFEKGIIESIKVQGDLPNYAINIKKAQVSHFILDSAGQNAILPGNLNRKLPNNQIRSEEPTTHSGMFYETMEETLLGECETYYTLSESGPYSSPRSDPLKAELFNKDQNNDNDNEEVRHDSNEDNSNSNEDSKEAFQHQKYMAYKDMAKRVSSGSSEETGALTPDIFHSFCEGKHLLMVWTKTVNYSACKEKPVLGYASPSFILNSRAGDNTFGAALGRVSYSTYIACGKDNKQFTLLKVHQEEQVNVGSLQKEKTVAGSVQNLTLILIASNGVLPVPPKNPIEITDLTYTYDAREQKLRGDGKLRTPFGFFEGDASYQYEGTQPNYEYQSGYYKYPTGDKYYQSGDKYTQSGDKYYQTGDKYYQSGDKYTQSGDKYYQSGDKYTPSGDKYYQSGDKFQSGDEYYPSGDKVQTGDKYYPTGDKFQTGDKYYPTGDKFQTGDKYYPTGDKQASGYNYQYNVRSKRAAEYYADSSEQEEGKNDYYYSYQLTAEGKHSLPKPPMNMAPLNPMLVSPLTREGMLLRVGVLLTEVVTDLTEDKPIAEKETLSKIATIAKILRFLGYVELDVLYNRHADKTQTEENQISRKVFLDAVAMAGTNPNIKLLVDLISKNKIVGEEASQLVMTFSMYVRTPTVELIKYIFEKLVDFTPRPESMNQVQTTSVLVFSNLIHDACVNTRISSSRYPIQIYGNFCNANFVEHEYLKHFAQQLKLALEEVKRNEHSVAATHWVTVYLAALGNTGHPAIVKEIQEILDTGTDTYIKTRAVFAFYRLLKSRSSQNVPVGEVNVVDRNNVDTLTDEVIEKEILPILVSVVFDKTEDQEVRMAAVSLLVKATPVDDTLWQQLAYSTWFELNQEVHSFIFHIISSLAKLVHPVDHHTWQAHKKAAAVLALMKPISIGLPRSRAHFESGFFEKIQSGFMQSWKQFGSENSVIPNAFYYQNYKSFGNGAFGGNPLEFSFHGQTLHEIFTHFVGKFQQPSQSIVEGNDFIKHIAELLNIVSRDQDETPQAAIQMKLQNEMERIVSVNREVIDQLIEKMRKTVIPAILIGHKINYQKTMKLADVTFEFPNIFGIPVTSILKSYSLVSLRGSVKANTVQKDIQVNLDLHPIVSYKTHLHITIKSPFSGKGYRAGVQHHVVGEFPHRAMFRKSAVGGLQYSITPTYLKEGSVAGIIDAINYHQVPYTMIITDELWPTNHKEGGQIKIVHATEKPYKELSEFGKSFAQSWRLEQQTDYQPEDEKYPGWARFFRQFLGTWGGWHHKMVMGAKTLRFAKRKLTLDVSESKTKTIVLLAAGKALRMVPHILTENSSEENKDNSGEYAEQTTGGPNRYYGTNTGNYQYENYNKKLNQYSYQDYYKNQYEKYLKSQETDSSSEESGETGGEQFAYSRDPKKQYFYKSYYESEAYQNVNPDHEYRRWAVVALLGKVNPLHEALKVNAISSQYQNTPSTVQYLLSADWVPGHVFVRASAGEATKEAAKELPQDSKAVDNIKQAIINSPLSNIQPPACGDYIGEYDFPRWANPKYLLVLREYLFHDELKVGVKGEISFGNSCHNKVHNITIKGQLSRNNDMLEWAKSGSFEAKKCTVDEKKGFFSSPVCIWNTEQQAAALNTAKFDIRATSLPMPVLNATLQFREFVKAWLYEYMSYNPIVILNSTPQNLEESYVKVDVKFTPQFDFLTLKFFRPEEIIFFQNIKLNQFARFIFPLTATQSIKENVRDRVFKTASSCSVEGTFVNTFDNVTYGFDPEATTNCHHVLVQDCSGEKAVSVLAYDVGEKLLHSTVVLLPGNFRVELRPLLRQSETPTGERYYVTASNNARTMPGQGRVLVNGVAVTNLPVTIRDKQGHFIARVQEGSQASLDLFADDVKVNTNGKHIVVYPSNMLRNSTCGLCGNFDVSKNTDFRSPSDCPLSSGTLTMAAYAFQLPWKKDSECKIAEDVKKAIEEEDNDCQTSDFYATSTDKSCKDVLIQKIGDAVYSLVRNALRPIPGVNGKKWAEQARDKVKELLKGKVNAKDIAEIIASGIAKWIPIPGVGTVLKPLIKAAVQKIVELICGKSGCCDTYYYF